jgi:hypothetical protein
MGKKSAKKAQTNVVAMPSAYTGADMGTMMTTGSSSKSSGLSSLLMYGGGALLLVFLLSTLSNSGKSGNGKSDSEGPLNSLLNPVLQIFGLDSSKNDSSNSCDAQWPGAPSDRAVKFKMRDTVRNPSSGQYHPLGDSMLKYTKSNDQWIFLRRACQDEDEAPLSLENLTDAAPEIRKIDGYVFVWFGTFWAFMEYDPSSNIIHIYPFPVLGGGSGGGGSGGGGSGGGGSGGGGSV